MPATLKDIAQRLNLSISTVSYALNDGPKPVSKEVRRRVLKVAKELDYRPNRLARSLVTRRTYTVGVVPVDVEEDILLNPFVHLALNGLVNASAKLRHDVLFFSAHDRNLPNEVVDDMLDGRVDGVVFIGPRPDSPALKQISESSLPYAIIAAEDAFGPSFVVDNEEGATMALAHLYELGHRRIAHVSGNLTLGDAQVRLNTYRKFLKQHGIEIPAEYVYQGDYWQPTGFKAGLAFLNLNPRPTAVFCANDAMAFGLINALVSHGVRVPEDISVIGFDDAPVGAIHEATLSTVRQPLQRMASDALNAVVHQIESGSVAVGRVFVPELVVRKSTARCAETQSFPA